jgi:putative endopeptidase
MTARITLLLLAALALPAFAQDHHGIDPTSIDPTVKPGDDFYHYADGNWIKHAEIPADRASLSVFATLADQANKRTAALIEDAGKSNPPAGSNARKIADLYASYMDEAAIEALGTKPLQPHLAAIAAIHTRRELAHALGLSLRADTDALNATNFHTPNLFGLWVAPGFNDPDHYAPYLMQGGLELPNREFYLGTSDRMKTIRAAYLTHIATMLKLAGFPDPDKRAAAILALETSIAQNHVSLADSENIEKANNTWKAADFPAKAPGLDWPEYFRAAGLTSQASFIVWQPSAFTAESALVASTPIETWKDYLAFHLIEAFSGVLPKAFVDERFAFFGKTLTGTTQMRPRAQRGIALVNSELGDAVGQLYVARYFTPEAKAQAQAMVDNIMTAFRIRLQNITWMALATKAEALAKLGTLNVGIGYPDTWRSYAGLEISPTDLFGNAWRSGLFDLHYNLSRIGQPVDRKEWCMEPQTVNAVNLPLDNGLNFPAAILQPPFFDPQAPAAVNYGAIGAIIGHEISHTFDSEGAAFDSKGRVRNWWTPADLAHFNASTAALAAQYDAYKPFPDLNLNGKQTLGENIADVAGLTAAYDGYKASLHGKEAPVVDGFTGDQQFFLAFARNYEGKAREAALRQQVLTDPHSPGQFRADTVRNLDPWYPAFNVQPGQTLYLAPADRVHIW